MADVKEDRAARAVAQWQNIYPEQDLSSMEMLGRLGECAAIIGRDFLAPVFAEFDLGPGEFDVLAALRRAGPPFEMTPTELFDLTMMSSGGMTARLDRVEKMGFIERRPNPNDRRGVLVGLTKSGKELIDRAVPAHVKNQARITAGLTKTEIESLSGLLCKLLSHTETMRDQAR